MARPRLVAWTLAGALAAAMASCGPSSSNSAGGGFAQGFQQAYDKSFNQAFDKSTHDSCVSSATGGGASADIADRYCTCVVAQLEPLSVQEKEGLATNQDKLRQAADACKSQLQ